MVNVKAHTRGLKPYKFEYRLNTVLFASNKKQAIKKAREIMRRRKKGTHWWEAKVERM